MPPCLPRFLAVVSLLASTAALAQEKIHYSLKEEPRRALPARVLLLPVEVTVRELSAGGVLDKVPEWTRQASEALVTGMQEVAQARGDFRLEPLPALDEDEQQQIEEYLAEYMVVGQTAYQMTAFPVEAWSHKRSHFDYTLGHGLDFLREKTGADAAIVIVGDDIVSTSGRKAVSFMAAALGVVVPMGQSTIMVGVVDLGTGDILWMRNDYSTHRDLKDPSTARQMLPEIWAGYPTTATLPAQAAAR